MRRLFTVLVSCSLLLFPGLLRAARGTGPGGYTWRDCFEPDGPPCGYSLTATDDGNTGLCTDEVYNDPRDNLGFTFPFYGVNYTDYTISANGTLYLQGRPGPGGDPNEAALTGREGRAFIAVLWDDWAGDNDDELAIICPDPGCSNSGPLTFVESFQRGNGVDAGVPYKEFGWYSTAHHRPVCTEDFGEEATFGLRLYADGRILMLYADTTVGLANVDNGMSATIGITSGAGGNYTQVSFDQASIPQNPYAILFTPPCSQLRCDSIGITPEPSCGVAQSFSVTTAGGVGPFTVAWDFDGDTLTDATGNPATTTLGVGSWPVTVTVTDSCPDPGPQTCSLASVATVSDPPAPTITPDGPTTFCAARGETVTLDAGAGFASYQWKRGGVTIGGATSQSYLTSVSGSYTVVVTDANGCTGTSAAVVVIANACGSCTPLTCTGITIAPNPTCKDTPQNMNADYIGGQGLVTVQWDLNGDTLPDRSGNPIVVLLPSGTWPITAVITDSCTTPGPQTCTVGPVDSVVYPDASALTEVSAPGRPPLLVAHDTLHVTVEGQAAATAYNINVDRIGSWYFPSVVRGTVCGIRTWTDNGNGTVTLDYVVPDHSWIVVTASNRCGEGPAGRNSRGVERSSVGTWEHCGPAP